MIVERIGARINEMRDKHSMIADIRRIAQKTITELEQADNQTYATKMRERISALGKNLNTHTHQGLREVLDYVRNFSIFSVTLQEVHSTLASRQALPEMSKLQTLVDAIETNITQSDSLQELNKYRSYLAHLDLFVKHHPDIIHVMAELDDITIDANLRALFEGPNELGGVLSADESVNGAKKMNISLNQTTEGSPIAIKLRDNIRQGDIGKWHTHPQGPPIPSGADLFNLHSGMDIGTFPHLIVATDEARLYIPDFLADLVSPELKHRLTRYTKDDRATELTSYGKAASASEQENILMDFDLYYLSIPVPGSSPTLQLTGR